MSTRLDELVRQWARALTRQELSPKTIETYTWVLRDFCRFLHQRDVTTAEALRRELIEDWQDDCRLRLSRASRSMAAVAVRQMLRWGVGRGLVDPHAPYWVTRVKGVRHHPRPIPIEDLRVILSHLAQQRFAGSLVDLRNRALFFYILSTGARVFEVLQLQRQDVRRAIITQKGGDDKRMEAPPIAIQALSEYLAERRDSNPWLWVTLDTNHPMRPLSPVGVREIWRRLAARLQMDPFTTHQLRHTGATELFEAGIDGLVIADWLGHKGLGHVPQYTGISWRRRQEALAVLQRLIEENGSPTTQRKEAMRWQRSS